MGEEKDVTAEVVELLLTIVAVISYEEPTNVLPEGILSGAVAFV